MIKSASTDDRLGDYTADTRLIFLAAVAALIGVTSAFVALALVRLIGLFTNLAYFHRLSTSFASPWVFACAWPKDRRVGRTT